MDDDDGRTTTTTLADGYEKNDEDDNDDDGPRRRRSRRRSRTVMRRRMMMISLLRGASTAKQSQGLSRAEPNSQERARAPPDRGRCALARGMCAGTGKADVYWRLDYVVLRRLRPL